MLCLIRMTGTQVHSVCKLGQTLKSSNDLSQVTNV